MFFSHSLSPTSFSFMLLCIITISFGTTVLSQSSGNTAVLNDIDHTLKVLTNSIVLYSSAFNSSSSKYFLSQHAHNDYLVAASQKISNSLNFLNRIMSSSGPSVIKETNSVLKEISVAVKDFSLELATIAKSLPDIANKKIFLDLVKAFTYLNAQFHYLDQRITGKAESVWMEANRIFREIRDNIGVVDRTLVKAVESMFELTKSQRTEYAAISNRFSLDLFKTQVDTSDKVVSAIAKSIGSYLASIENRVSGESDSVWRKSAQEFRSDFSLFIKNLEGFLKTFAHSHLPTQLTAHSEALNTAMSTYSDRLVNRLSSNSDSLTMAINDSVHFDVKMPIEELTRQLHLDFMTLDAIITNLTTSSMSTFTELHQDFLKSFDTTFAKFVRDFVSNFNISMKVTGMTLVDYFLNGLAPSASGRSYPDGPGFLGGVGDWIASALATLLEPFWRTLLLIVKEIVYLVFEAIIFLMSRLFEVFTALASVFEKEFEALFNILYRFATLGFQTFLRIILKIEENILLSEYLFLFIVLTYYGLPWRTALIFIFFIILFLGILRTHLSLVLALLNPQFKNFTFTSSIAFIGNYHPSNIHSPMSTVALNDTYVHCTNEYCITIPAISSWNVTLKIFKNFFSHWDENLSTLRYING